MRTVRCSSRLPGGVYPWGVFAWGVSNRGVLPGGGLPVGGLPGGVCTGRGVCQTPSPVNRMTDRRLWKYYLADGYKETIP